MVHGTSDQEILDIWLPRINRLFGFSLQDFDGISAGVSIRDNIWQLLSNLDSGALSLNERVYVYSSMALFLEEEGKDPTEALDKIKHLTVTNGGKSVIFEANRFFFFPIEDTPIENTIPLVILGETLQGVPLRNRSIMLLFITQDDNESHQRLDTNLDQCGVSVEFLSLDPQLFQEPTIVKLYMTSDSLEEEFDILREHVANFKLLPAFTSSEEGENGSQTPA